MSVAPVLWVYGIVGAIGGHYIRASCVGGVGVLFLVGGILLLRYYHSNAERIPLQLTGAEAADQESLGILVLYLVPLLETPTLQTNWVILIPAGALFLAWMVTGHYHHLNPLLVIMGWHFYKVSTPEGISYILLSRQKLRNVTKYVNVIELSTYTLMDRGETHSLDDKDRDNRGQCPESLCDL